MWRLFETFQGMGCGEAWWRIRSVGDLYSGGEGMNTVNAKRMEGLGGVDGVAREADGAGVVRTGGVGLEGEGGMQHWHRERARG